MHLIRQFPVDMESVLELPSASAPESKKLQKREEMFLVGEENVIQSIEETNADILNK